MTLAVLALHERSDDAVLLADHFLRREATEHGVTAEALLVTPRTIYKYLEE